ncbi:MAG: hypothetical protein JW757_03245 [Anaerolineales bacterium]|nr:hypothetical protein [Anaerolineales bacterium]
MNSDQSILLLILLVLLVGCSLEPHLPADPGSSEPVGQYQYQVGLGYGFLGNKVQVSVDGEEILSIIGTEEIEEYAQLLGTKMLAGGSAEHPVVTVRVVVDGGSPVEEMIDLGQGGFIHIYFGETGVQIFNTSELVLE